MRNFFTKPDGSSIDSINTVYIGPQNKPYFYNDAMLDSSFISKFQTCNDVWKKLLVLGNVLPKFNLKENKVDFYGWYVKDFKTGKVFTNKDTSAFVSKGLYNQVKIENQKLIKAQMEEYGKNIAVNLRNGTFYDLKDPNKDLFQMVHPPKDSGEGGKPWL